MSGNEKQRRVRAKVTGVEEGKSVTLTDDRYDQTFSRILADVVGPDRAALFRGRPLSVVCQGQSRLIDPLRTTLRDIDAEFAHLQHEDLELELSDEATGGLAPRRGAAKAEAGHGQS